ncbi:CinA family protein [Rhizobium paknamense]|uniref:Nicotinamide-nucleotide amidase n=1 Tax=Rhizobium paknamense TaxID=1206817 RepID=A0ABU0I650_9HYPH|nr:CinA family protein [Rhizobium paknamense]MDQ0453708.1 nicotinamide-nucleotide amidase [Rhizobium paknamense]
MSLFPSAIEEKAKAIIADFSVRGLTIATAESCTGGLIAGALTEIAGSSAVVLCGYVTYSNQAKMDMLGVPAVTLEIFGAVSQQTALAMAHGALYRSGAALSVAVTGIAGPGGGSVEKPVGLVHLAAMNRHGATKHREMQYGDLGREGVRMATLHTALEMLIEAAQA